MFRTVTRGAASRGRTTTPLAPVGRAPVVGRRTGDTRPSRIRRAASIRQCSRARIPVLARHAIRTSQVPGKLHSRLHPRSRTRRNRRSWLAPALASGNLSLSRRTTNSWSRIPLRSRVRVPSAAVRRAPLDGGSPPPRMALSRSSLRRWTRGALCSGSTLCTEERRANTPRADGGRRELDAGARAHIPRLAVHPARQGVLVLEHESHRASVGSRCRLRLEHDRLPDRHGDFRLAISSQRRLGDESDEERERVSAADATRRAHRKQVGPPLERLSECRPRSRVGDRGSIQVGESDLDAGGRG